MHTTLTTWRKLNALIDSVDEETCAELIRFEIKNQARKTVLKRLHGRYNTLRIRRERELIIAGKF